LFKKHSIPHVGKAATVAGRPFDRPSEVGTAAGWKDVNPKRKSQYESKKSNNKENAVGPHLSGMSLHDHAKRFAGILKPLITKRADYAARLLRNKSQLARLEAGSGNQDIKSAWFGKSAPDHVQYEAAIEKSDDLNELVAANEQQITMVRSEARNMFGKNTLPFGSRNCSRCRRTELVR